MQRTEWLALRREGIGASDIAAVCGLSPYSTALEVYLDKLGLHTSRETEGMVWGTMQEASLARWYEAAESCRLVDPGPIRSPEHPWIMATPDRQREGEAVYVELKTAQSREGWGEPGSDLVPVGYLLQACWQMIASHGVIERVDICATICGAPPVTYCIRPDVALFRRLHAIGAEFWGRVLEKRPPEPDWGHSDTPALVEMLYRPTEGVSVELDTAALDLVERWEGLRGERLESAKWEERLKAEIAEALGQASEGLLPDGRIVTRKLVTVRAHQREESTRIDLRIKKGRS